MPGGLDIQNTEAQMKHSNNTTPTSINLSLTFFTVNEVDIQRLLAERFTLKRCKENKLHVVKA